MNTLSNLNYIVDKLEKHNLNYWFDGGTLLGMARNNNFIPGDKDIDLGGMFSDFHSPKGKKFFDELKKEGFTVTERTHGFQIMVTKPKTTSEEAFNIDFWLVKRSGNYYYHPGWRGIFVFPKYHYKHFQFFIVGGRKYNVPDFTYNYLRDLYGEDFMTPKPMKKPEDFKNYIPFITNNT